MVAADMQSSSSRSLGPQLKLPEPLQDPHDLFHEGGQALAAGAVERGPHLEKRGRQLRPVYEHLPPRLPWLRPTGRLPERAACVIAVPSRERTQLIQDRPFPFLDALRYRVSVSLVTPCAPPW